MRYLSVCSGIEAATVAWHPLGWTPVAFSEIEPFPAAVLAHHYPNVPNYGDMTKHKEWPLEPGAIDLLVGGTPCQSFSVAGLRKGISDPRGGLMLTYLEIAQRLRPRWIVWENVPGVLSSGGGRDFGSFLGALGELGYGWAYRVLDAQWVRTQRHPRAVPQRRRRVFVVGCLGDWERAAQVLFERESVQRDSAPRRTQGEGVAADAEAGAGAGCWWDGGRCAGKLTKQNAGGAQRMPDKDNFGAVLQPVGYRWQNDRDGLVEDGTAPACLASAGSSGFHEMNHPVVLARDNAAHAAVAFTPGNLARGAGPSPNAEVAPTQRCSAGRGADDQRTCVAMVGTDLYNGAITGDVAATMGTPGSSVNASGRNTPMAAVAFPWQSALDPIGNPSEVSGTLIKNQTMGVAHCLRGSGFDASEDGTGRGTPLVPVETLQQQGYNGDHASTQEANAVATLRVLRDEIGEEAFAAWGLGVLDSLQPSQILRARLHGDGIRCASFSRSWPIDCAISRPEDRATWAVQSVREAEGEGCSPSRRELPQQLAEQLGAYLSQLPCPGPQAEKLMHHLWCAGEGIGILRQALSAIQEARRSTDVPRTTPANTMTVRRLTATECEFLQGFPRNYTLIPWRKKPAAECPDGPRYKALGNSMAVNCMAWIGERIAAIEAREQ